MTPEETAQLKEKELKNDPIFNLIIAEYNSLRKYVETYIQCRTTYFWGSLAAAGATLTFMANLLMYSQRNTSSISTNIDYHNYIMVSFIAPLFIITPFWCVYFDKTSTIVRISAYIRVLEYIIINYENNKHLYCGFETYVKFYRNDTRKSYHTDKQIFIFYISRIWKFIKIAVLVKDSGFSKVLNFRMPNQEIYISWAIFFLISILCLVMVTISTRNYYTVGASFFIFFMSFIYTLYVVRELVDTNSRSQTAREEQCRRILKEINTIYKDDITKRLSENSENTSISFISVPFLIFISFVCFICYYFYNIFPVAKY